MGRKATKPTGKFDSWADRTLNDENLAAHTDGSGRTDLQAMMTDSVLANLGHNLKEARTRARMSQTDAAAKSGLSRHAISYLENDGRAPTLKELVILSTAYGVTVAQLIGEITDEEARLLQSFRGAYIPPEDVSAFDLETLLDDERRECAVRRLSDRSPRRLMVDVADQVASGEYEKQLQGYARRFLLAQQYLTELANRFMKDVGSVPDELLKALRIVGSPYSYLPKKRPSLGK